MTTRNSVLKAARIREADWEILKGYIGDRTFGEFIHELAQEIESKGALTGINTGIMGDLTMMCNLYGITVNDLLTDLCDKVDKGEIRIENGKIVLN